MGDEADRAYASFLLQQQNLDEIIGRLRDIAADGRPRELTSAEKDDLLKAKKRVNHAYEFFEAVVAWEIS